MWWHEKITLSPRVPGEMRSQAPASCLASGYLMYKLGQALNWLCFNFWFLFSLTSALLRGPGRFVLFIAILGKAVESWSQIHINGLGFSGHSSQQRLHSAAFLMVWHLYPVDILAFTAYLHISVFNSPWLSHDISLQSNSDLSASWPKGSESYHTASHTALRISGNLPYTPQKPEVYVHSPRFICDHTLWSLSLFPVFLRGEQEK